MRVDLAALCRARETGNGSERNPSKEEELGVSSEPPLTLGVLLRPRARVPQARVGSFAVFLHERFKLDASNVARRV